MSTRTPSFYLLVPGPWREARSLVELLVAKGLPAEMSLPDPIAKGRLRVEIVEGDDFDRACAWGRYGRLPEDLLKKAGQCSSAALIECGFLLHEDPALMARLGSVLQDAGGVLVRMEASGAASDWKSWIKAMESGTPWAIYCSSVLMVGDDEDGTVTCGMHQFDLPDARICMSDPVQAMAWLDTLCVYQIAEKPLLQSGHTFSPDEETPRRKIERWPDLLHHSGDGRSNPFGMWKVLEPGDNGVASSNPTPVMMPALLAILTNAERQKGSPLTREEVESLRDQSAAIMMEAADAAALERSRGYADILPERAWEQWHALKQLNKQA
ncbi:MAG: hypothetical protein RL095_2612 [Verrucomicrobiota bacterium]|jgi:hypothetical protein